MSAASQKVGRYDPCSCGSGKKYKFCCEKADRAKDTTVSALLNELSHAVRDLEAFEDLGGEEPSLLEYEITGEPVADGLEGVPDEVVAQYAELHELAMRAPEQAIPRLEPLVAEYPFIPVLKNWLAVAYQNLGRGDDSDAMEERVWRDHPDYLFGRVGRAHHHLRRNELDMVPEVLGGLDLKQMYPHRSVFHVSEAIALWAVLAEWCFRTGDDEAAQHHLDNMRDLDPESPLTERTELLLMPLALKGFMSRMLGRRRNKAAPKPKRAEAARSGRPKRIAGPVEAVLPVLPRNAC